MRPETMNADFLDFELSEADKQRWAPVFGLRISHYVEEIGYCGKEVKQAWFSMDGRLYTARSNLNFIERCSEDPAMMRDYII